MFDFDAAEERGDDYEVEDEEGSEDFEVEAVEEGAPNRTQRHFRKHLPQLHFQDLSLEWLVFWRLRLVILYHVVWIDFEIEAAALVRLLQRLYVLVDLALESLGFEDFEALGGTEE